jgi:hypothetical protein
MLPMVTPPNMLRPPSLTVIRGCLEGLRKYPLPELGERIADMPDDTKALVLLHELDHLIWLKTIWPDMDHLVHGVEMEHRGTWKPLTADAARWCLLDRYRAVDLDREVRTWLESAPAGSSG